MSCQQLYIEQKIEIILYAAKHMHMSGLIIIMSLLKGGGGSPQKIDRL